MSAFSLDGKVAVVVGARRGMGEALALGFARAGADVVIADVRVDDGRLDALADRSRSSGRRAFGCGEGISALVFQVES